MVFAEYERFRVRQPFALLSRTIVQDIRLGTGASGPAFFGLGVKQTLIVLSVVDIMYVLITLCVTRRASLAEYESVPVSSQPTCTFLYIFS